MDFSPASVGAAALDEVAAGRRLAIARLISEAELAVAENGKKLEVLRSSVNSRIPQKRIPVIGLTGTGGAGKSSLTDELVLRLLYDNPQMRIGILCCDPSRRKTGGALLGDRIRMNAIDSSSVYMRSMAVRRASQELPAVLPDAVDILKCANDEIWWPTTRHPLRN